MNGKSLAPAKPASLAMVKPKERQVFDGTCEVHDAGVADVVAIQKTSHVCELQVLHTASDILDAGVDHAVAIHIEVQVRERRVLDSVFEYRARSS